VLTVPGGIGAVPEGAAWLPGDVLGDALGEPVRGTPGVVDGGHGMPVVTPAPAVPVLDGKPDVELGADGLPGRQFGSSPDPGVDGDTPRVPLPAVTGAADRRRPTATAVVISFITPSLMAFGGQQRGCQRQRAVSR
jgi:hypothetical protein